MIRKCFRIFLLLFVEHEYSVSSDTGQQPKFSKSHYNRAFVWDLIPRFIMMCLVLSLRGVSHSAKAQTELLMAEGTVYSSFPSHLWPASGEPRTATSKFTFGNPPVGRLQHNTWYFICPCQWWKMTYLCRKQAANNPYSPFSSFGWVQLFRRGLLALISRGNGKAQLGLYLRFACLSVVGLKLVRFLDNTVVGFCIHGRFRLSLSGIQDEKSW